MCRQVLAGGCRCGIGTVHQQTVDSANDFKAFAESLKKPEPEATPEIKPLGDESARMLANFDPGRSSISTYQGVWNS